ncbi:MAG: FAD:protein FMN transferase [Bacteroidales bacterium]|nr:FAD:protein FMN transferase [Bacteroidales bacterium]
MKKTVIALLFTLILSACGPKDRFIQVSGHAQGGVYTVKVNLKGVTVPPEEIRDSVDAILTRVDTTLSGYNKGSLLSRFNAGETIRPNGLFLEMYRVGYEWFERSAGVLDFAAGPLFDAWGFGFKSGEMPSDEAVAAIQASCGMGLLQPSMTPREDGTLSVRDLRRDGTDAPVVLNYNAIAQGYTCDLVAAYLYSIGVKDMLVDIGEIWCDGHNPSGRPWNVGVDRPYDRPDDGTDRVGAELDGVWSSAFAPAGIVTSGNYRKFYVRDGRKYAHSIDPRSGYPVNHNLLSATVVSPEGAADADALATWCMVVGLDAARALLLGQDGVEGYLIYTAEDGTMTEWASPGFTLTK